MNIEKPSLGFVAIYAILTIASTLISAHLLGSMGLIFISVLVGLGVAAFTWGLVEYVLEESRTNGILLGIFWGVTFFSVTAMFINIGPLASLAIIGAIFVALIGFMFLSGLVDAIDNKVSRVKEARRLKKEQAESKTEFLPVGALSSTYPVNPPTAGSSAVE